MWIEKVTPYPVNARPVIPIFTTPEKFNQNANSHRFRLLLALLLLQLRRSRLKGHLVGLLLSGSLLALLALRHGTVLLSQVVEEALGAALLALLDKRSQAILGALLALLAVLAKDFVVNAQLFSVLFGLSRLFLGPPQARRTLRLGLLGVCGEAGDILLLDGGVDDLAEALLILQHVAKNNVFEDGVHIALTLLVGDEEVVLLLV